MPPWATHNPLAATGAGLQREQHFWWDHVLASACELIIVRVHTFYRIIFLHWSNEILTFVNVSMISRCSGILKCGQHPSNVVSKNMKNLV